MKSWDYWPVMGVERVQEGAAAQPSGGEKRDTVRKALDWGELMNFYYYTVHILYNIIIIYHIVYVNY